MQVDHADHVVHHGPAKFKHPATGPVAVTVYQAFAEFLALVLTQGQYDFTAALIVGRPSLC
jgi:hypothetical protein